MLSWSHRFVIRLEKNITRIAAQFRHREVVEWWDVGIQQVIPKKQPLAMNMRILDGVGSRCRVELGTMMKSVRDRGNNIIHVIVGDWAVDRMSDSVTENQLRYIDSVIH